MGWYLFSEDKSEVERDDGVRDLTFLLPWHCCRRPPPSADVKRAIVITNTRELIYEFPLLLDAYRSGDVDVDGGRR
jgi:hypothetical protein